MDLPEEITRFAYVSAKDKSDIRKLITGGGKVPKVFREVVVDGRCFNVVTEYKILKFTTGDHCFSLDKSVTHLQNGALSTLYRKNMLFSSSRGLVISPETLEVFIPPQNKSLAPKPFAVGVADVDRHWDLPYPAYPIPVDRLGGAVRWLSTLATSTPSSRWARAIFNVFSKYMFNLPIKIDLKSGDSVPILLLLPGLKIAITTYTRTMVAYPDWIRSLDTDKLVGAPLNQFAQDPNLYFKLAETVEWL